MIRKWLKCLFNLFGHCFWLGLQRSRTLRAPVSAVGSYGNNINKHSAVLNANPQSVEAIVTSTFLLLHHLHRTFPSISKIPGMRLNASNLSYLTDFGSSDLPRNWSLDCQWQVFPSRRRGTALIRKTEWIIVLHSIQLRAHMREHLSAMPDIQRFSSLGIWAFIRYIIKKLDLHLCIFKICVFSKYDTKRLYPKL